MFDVHVPEHRCADGCRFAKSSESWLECHYGTLPFENLRQMIAHSGCDLFEKGGSDSE